MVGVARVIALAAAAMVAGCVTDGMVGAEVDGAAKPRVIDTPKTRTAAGTAAKKEAARTAASEATKREARKAAPETSQGDTEMRVAAAPEPDPRESRSAPADSTLIPAHSLFGNWTLGQDGGAKCRLILGGVPIGAAYAARGEADCPTAFASVQTWEIQGDQIVLRNQSRAVVGRLQATGPARFDGQAESGAAVYLMR